MSIIAPNQAATNGFRDRSSTNDHYSVSGGVLGTSWGAYVGAASYLAASAMARITSNSAFSSTFMLRKK